MRFTGLLCLLIGLSTASAQDMSQRADGPSDQRPAVNALPADAAASQIPHHARTARTAASICLIVEAAARAHGLPLEFFARVIWQESRFRPDAIGPVTRSGERAQGIAQFMPGTAEERRLLDPFDPVQALPKSAEFLRDLRAEFGNLGLAAAAYNAGPQRVRDWLAGRRTLPAETRHYVFAITGSPAEDWAEGGRDAARKALPALGCGGLVALLREAPNPFVAELERRVERSALLPWGVQLAAGFSRDRALTSYARLQERFSGLLAGQDPSILATTLRSRGTRAFYQVRVGAETRTVAERLCGRVRRAGGACMVLRNPRR